MRRKDGELREIGDGLFAWLQLPGSWGYNNAGLVASGERSLLVDTLFDLRLTQRMLDAMRAATRAADTIDVVVNTHANGDHCWGNQLVRGAEIIASRASAEEMIELSPKLVHTLVRVARASARPDSAAAWATRLLGRAGLARIAAVGRAAPFVVEIFGDFDFAGIELAPPTRTFDTELELAVGDRRVVLHEVGPAHTRGDTLVHLPDDGVVFTGDILFHGSHPIVWEGPVENWIAACDRIEAMAPEVVVPGHGPLADLDAVRSLRHYLETLLHETRARFEAGVPLEEAALEVGDALDALGRLGERERVAVNVDTLYRHLSHGEARPDPVELFARMREYGDRLLPRKNL